MATTEGFGRIWAGLIAQYPMAFRDVSPDILKHTFAQYARLTADIPDQQLEAAALSHVASCKWFPTVSELRDEAYNLMNANQLSAEEAWGRATQLVSRGEDDGDPLIRKAVHIMGWSQIRMRLEDSEHVNRAHFFRIYEMLRKREKSAVMMLPEIRAIVERLSFSRAEGQKRLRDGLR